MHIKDFVQRKHSQNIPSVASNCNMHHDYDNAIKAQFHKSCLLCYHCDIYKVCGNVAEVKQTASLLNNWIKTHLHTCNKSPEHFGPHFIQGEPTSTRGIPKLYKIIMVVISNCNIWWCLYHVPDGPALPSLEMKRPWILMRNTIFLSLPLERSRWLTSLVLFTSWQTNYSANYTSYAHQ